MRFRLVKMDVDLSLASSYYMVRLVWVPGNTDIAENCKAVELTWKGISVSITVEWERVEALASSDLQLNSGASKR